MLRDDPRIVLDQHTIEEEDIWAGNDGEKWGDELPEVDRKNIVILSLKLTKHTTINQTGLYRVE